MTDAPEKVWIGSRETYWQSTGVWDASGPDPGGISAAYIREDVALAMVAAARKVRAGTIVGETDMQGYIFGPATPEQIRALTDPDAKAALDRLIAEAVDRTYDRALQAIADLPTGRTEDVMEGQEQAYRAIEAIRRGDDAAP